MVSITGTPQPATTMATAATLARCLERLTAEQRKCLRLAYAGGHSHAHDDADDHHH